jgi:hypothetical protein
MSSTMLLIGSLYWLTFLDLLSGCNAAIDSFRTTVKQV